MGDLQMKLSKLFLAATFVTAAGCADSVYEESTTSEALIGQAGDASWSLIPIGSGQYDFTLGTPSGDFVGTTDLVRHDIVFVGLFDEPPEPDNNDGRTPWSPSTDTSRQLTKPVQARNWANNGHSMDIEMNREVRGAVQTGHSGGQDIDMGLFNPNQVGIDGAWDTVDSSVAFMPTVVQDIVAGLQQ